MTLYQRYKRYDNGGTVEDQTAKRNQALGVGTSAAAAGAAIAEAIDPGNQYGRQSTATNIAKGVSTFGSLGAQFGPTGAAIGAGVGLVSGLVNARKQKELESQMKFQEYDQQYQSALSKYSARAASDSTLVQGVKGANYFGNGGSLYSSAKQRIQARGELKKLNSNTVDVVGPGHENGGVDLPTGDEVEGGETITGNYVMSDKLGFSRLHRPIAKAIGVLEGKAPSSAVNNSLNRLREKEKALIMLQEQYRQQHNLV